MKKKLSEKKVFCEKWLWIDLPDLVAEKQQLTEEGRDISSVRVRLNTLIRKSSEELAAVNIQQRAAALLDETIGLPMRRDYKFNEPSDLAGINSLRPRGQRRFNNTLSRKALFDHVHGAWIGRCAGCLLGKPVEGTRTETLWPFLKASGQWPLRNYIRFDLHKKKYKEFESFMTSWRRRMDKIDHMPIDDDTNYTVTGLLILERKGIKFTSADVAHFWLQNLPLTATCTAERVAYRNFAMGINPPESATFRNPYREWIGAQIRADAYGYVALGNPQLAAELAWRDACISHVKNGIYGAMWVAAMIAAAPFAATIEDLIRIGLAQIPANSRLHRNITEIIAAYHGGMSYDDACTQIHRKWNEGNAHDWCHTNSNAAIVALALLYGEENFTQSLGMSVQACFDTDCNGATVGSVLGMRLGAKQIPASWSDRLNDTLRTSLDGNHTVKISDMARRTVALLSSR